MLRLLETLPDAVLLVDSGGAILLANAQAESLLGYGPGELAGLAVEQLVPAAARERHARLCQEYAVAPSHRTMGSGLSLKAVRRDGSEFAVDISLGPVEHEGRQLVVCALRDLTSRLQAEQETLRQQLERLAVAATLGEYSAAVAHEVNQPLCAIVTNAQAVLRLLRKPGVDLREIELAVAEIVQDGKRAGAVVQRLRHLMSRRPLASEPTDVNECVCSCLAMLQSELVRQDVQWQVELAADGPRGLAGPLELQHVLLNLMTNACQAMEQAERKLLTLRTARAGGEIRIAVRDTGHGLRAPCPEDIFQPFYTTRAEGLGMGLALCRSLVEGLGGRLRVRENSEGGCTFEVGLLEA